MCRLNITVACQLVIPITQLMGSDTQVCIIGGMITTRESTQRKASPNANFPTTNPTWTVLRLNQGLHHEMPASNQLSYSMDSPK
jgi:hypothetical protein